MNNTSATSAADDLVLNAELRTELEPYSDESVTSVKCDSWSIKEENQYLSSILQWEKAPVLPIYRWFEPELHLHSVHKVTDEELPDLLNSLVQKLYEKKIVLDFTDHLSDRELYLVIVQKILPQNEKKIDSFNTYRHWDCSRIDETGDEAEDARIWLTYYASDLQRERWAELYGFELPEKAIPLHHRDFPRDDSFHY